MRVGYFECFSGISGDMVLGALLDAGIDLEFFRATVAALGLDARMEFERVQRCGISAIKAHVLTAEGEHDHAHAVLAHGSPDDAHSHHGHDHAGDHHHHHSHQHGRSFQEICRIISAADLASAPREMALRAFRLLAEAEAKIHDIPVESIHFHEVGATDAIVDIVCAAAGCHALGVDRWMCSPLNVGSGTVQCAHGVFPVPAPATVELLKGARVYSSGIQAELVTPTGAAILRALDVEFADMPSLTLDRAAYGAGSRDLPGVANVVRLTLGNAEIAIGADTVTVLETAVDDLTPQLIGHVMDRALAEGALDVMITPVQMKKNRPGHLLTVLCRPQDTTQFRDLLLRETTTLGVRIRNDRRECLQRSFETVNTPWGDVRIKLAHLNGEIVNCAPEFEDCRRLAQQHHVAAKIVMQEAMRLFQRERSSAAERPS